MDARVRKQHVLTVRSVGVYRVMYHLAVDQSVCFTSGRVAMLSLVLWAIPRGTMRAMGCGTWSGVRAGRLPFPFLLFPLSRYAGTYTECSGILTESRYYLDRSKDRYRSAYPCTESSGGPLACRTRTGVCRGWSRLRDVYRAVSSSLPGSLAM